jgi:hypothetical protein
MLATIAVKSQFLGANREINIGHHLNFARCWLQWNAAIECNVIMLPLAASQMHYYPVARCNPILPFNSKRARLPNPVTRGGMATPVGANRQ